MDPGSGAGMTKIKVRATASRRKLTAKRRSIKAITRDPGQDSESVKAGGDKQLNNTVMPAPTRHPLQRAENYSGKPEGLFGQACRIRNIDPGSGAGMTKIKVRAAASRGKLTAKRRGIKAITRDPGQDSESVKAGGDKQLNNTVMPGPDPASIAMR